MNILCLNVRKTQKHGNMYVCTVFMEIKDTFELKRQWKKNQTLNRKFAMYRTICWKGVLFRLRP